MWERAARERLARVPRRLIDAKDWRPRSLYYADLAIRQGVPLRDLSLSTDEQAVLIAGCDFFGYDLRMEAAAELAGRYRWARAHDDDLLDVQRAIVQAGEAAWEPIESFPTPTLKGRPRRVPWCPAREDWRLLLGWYLPWRLRKHHVRPREEDALRRTVSLPEAPAVDDGDVPPAVRRVAGWPFADPVTSQAKPPQALRGVSTAYGEALRLRLGSKMLSNPQVPAWMLKEMRAELDGDEWPARRTYARPGEGEQQPPERMALYGKTADRPFQHLLGWADEIDSVALAESGRAWDFRRRWIRKDRDDVSTFAVVDGRDDLRAIRDGLQETNRRLEELASLVIYTRGKTPAEEAERFLADDEAA